MSDYMPTYIDKDFAIQLLKMRGIDDRGTLENLTPESARTVEYGRWERDNDVGAWECSNCMRVCNIILGEKNETCRMPFCPHCGAEMDGGYCTR